jgi:hypothetical protein
MTVGVIMKPGSMFKVPVPAGFTASSDKPAVCNAAVSGTTLSITAGSQGSANLTLKPATDVGVTLAVTVSAA